MIKHLIGFRRMLGQTVVWLAASLLIAEVVARYAFGLEPLTYTRNLQPIYVSGDGTPPSSHEQWRYAPGGPGGLGYRAHGLTFAADTTKPTSHTTTVLSDFLFDHFLSRYSAEDVDRILCDNPKAMPIFVLGGSGGQGSSASTKLKVWHALLEDALRRKLHNPNVFVFNGAMGGFISLQERLAFHLAVLPRHRGAVLFFNSYNDLIVPMAGLTRPGDPYWTGVWYANVYSSRLLFWAAENSAIVNTILKDAEARRMARNVTRINEDSAILERVAAAAIDTYMENMEQALSICEALNRPCWVALQPNRALTSTQLGKPIADVIPAAKVGWIYDMARQRIAASRYANRFIDLTAVLHGGTAEMLFTDPVHFTDSAQVMVANALLEPIAAGMAAGGETAVDVGRRCQNRLEWRLLVEVPLDKIVERGEGRVRKKGDLLEIDTDPVQWNYAALLPVPLDKAWQSLDLKVRVRLRALQGDTTVVAVDETGRSVSDEKPFIPGDGDAIADLIVRGHPANLSIAFKKLLDDGRVGTSVVESVVVFGR
jgi:lysophospholipase L1-like esterase